MKSTWYRITIPVVTFLLASCGATFAQQNTPKDKDAEKPPTTTTVDAWRQALPQNEIAVPPDAATTDVEAAESPEQLRQRLDALERRWMEATKSQDVAALKRIIADDFTLAGQPPAGIQLDQTGYFNSALKDWKLSTYSFDRLTVRLYGETAVVSALFKQQASVAGQDWSGDFLITDVWVKQGKRWRVVARHISRAPGAANS